MQGSLPTPQEYIAFGEQGINRVALWKKVEVAIASPLSIYAGLACDGDKETGFQPKLHSFFLESNEKNTAKGRFSIIGLPSKLLLQTQGQQVSVIRDGKLEEKGTEPDTLAWLQSFLNRFKSCPNTAKLPISSGIFGYLGYEMVHQIEPILLKTQAKHDFKAIPSPDSAWFVPNEIIVHDGLTGSVWAIVFADPTSNQSYDDATQLLQELSDKVLQSPSKLDPFLLTEDSISDDQFVSGFGAGEQTYIDSVKQIKQLIHTGEAFQVVLATSFSTPISISNWMLYRSIRQVTPSAYMYLMNFGDFTVAGSSPECLVKSDSFTESTRKATINPIAGTRRRGKTLQEDRDLADEMANDPKENAEHLMLVDLGRNDAGRIAKAGTVKVLDYKRVKKYRQVMHMLSTVQAHIENDLSQTDIVRATFPTGTLSGAPKVRAMQIIREHEYGQRGPYGGGVGYFGFDGRVDLAICIRTAVVDNVNAMLYVSAGAGVVADSVPELEWKECTNKARSIVRSVTRIQEKLN